MRHSSKAIESEWPTHLIDHDAERFVLGTMVSSWQSEAAGLIDESCFSSHQLAQLWRLCERLMEEGITPCLSEIMRVSMSENLGFGFTWLLDLKDQGIPDATLTRWLDKLRELAKLREAYRIGQAIQIGGIEAIEDARKKLHDLERMGGDTKPQTLGMMLEALGGPDAILKRPEGLIAPPWPILRSTLNGGLAPKSVTVLAARPSEGKSSLAWQWALCAAAEGHRTALFSLETGEEELLRRAWAERCTIPLQQIISGTLGSLQRNSIRQCNAEIDGWPLEIYCDKFGLRDITQVIRRRKDPIRFAVIDYLGLVNANRRSANRNEEVSFISRKFKELAMERDIPILALHQLNRASESDGQRRPELSDLRDSGSLEQDADNVLFIYRPSAKRGSAENPALREIIVKKQRNGKRDVSVNYTFQGEYVRFLEDN